MNFDFEKLMSDPQFMLGLSLMSQWKTPPGQMPSLGSALENYSKMQMGSYLGKKNKLEMAKMEREESRQKAYEGWAKENVKPAVPQTPYTEADNPFNEDLGKLYNAGSPATMAGQPIDPGLAGLIQFLPPEDVFKLYTKKDTVGDKATQQMKNWEYAKTLSPEDQKLFWDRMGGSSGGTAAIQDFEKYKGLSPEERILWAESRRAPTYLDQGGYRIQALPGGDFGPAIPKTLPPQEVPSVIGQQAEARAVGTKQGEIAVDEPKAKLRIQSNDQKLSIIEQNAARAKAQVGAFSTGLPGQVLSNIGGTEARNLRATLDTIKANIGFDELQQMRQESPTGGALGQVAVQEINYLQSVIASLDQAQTPEELIQKIDEVVAAKRASNERVKAAFQATYGQAQQTERPPSQQNASKPEITRQYNDAMKRAKGNPSLQKKLTDLYNERMKQ